MTPKVAEIKIVHPTGIWKEIQALKRYRWYSFIGLVLMFSSVLQINFSVWLSWFGWISLIIAVTSCLATFFATRYLWGGILLLCNLTLMFDWVVMLGPEADFFLLLVGSISIALGLRSLWRFRRSKNLYQTQSVDMHLRGIRDQSIFFYISLLLAVATFVVILLVLPPYYKAYWQGLLNNPRVLFFGLMFVIPIVFWRLSIRLWQPHTSLSLEDTDILLLRSFGDDGLIVKPDVNFPSIWNGLIFSGKSLPATLGLGDLETCIIKPLRLKGAVSAARRPGEKVPPLGANRITLAQDDWKEQIRNAIVQSHTVVTIVGLTQALDWEFTQIMELRNKKSLFVVPPSSNQSSFLTLVEPLNTYFGLDLRLLERPILDVISKSALIIEVSAKKSITLHTIPNYPTDTAYEACVYSALFRSPWEPEDAVNSLESSTKNVAENLPLKDQSTIGPWAKADPKLATVSAIGSMFKLHVSGKLSPVDASWESIALSKGEDDFLSEELENWIKYLPVGFCQNQLQAGEVFLVGPCPINLVGTRRFPIDEYACLTTERLLIFQKPDDFEVFELKQDFALEDVLSYQTTFFKTKIETKNGMDVFFTDCQPPQHIVQWVLSGMSIDAIPEKKIEPFFNAVNIMTIGFRLSTFSLLPLLFLIFGGFPIGKAFLIFLSYPVIFFMAGYLFSTLSYFLKGGILGLLRSFIVMWVTIYLFFQIFQFMDQEFGKAPMDVGGMIMVISSMAAVFAPFLEWRFNRQDRILRKIRR